jgi:hypothetical protein
MTSQNQEEEKNSSEFFDFRPVHQNCEGRLVLPFAFFSCLTPRFVRFAK